MIPKEEYKKLDPEEQKLWHSHVFEVKSGMLVLPYPATHKGNEDKWDKLETEPMEEVAGLYGKLYHFWQIDRGDDIPLGHPRLMGRLTSNKQCDIDEAMSSRNMEGGIDMGQKRKMREHIEPPGIHKHADSWWSEAKEGRRGIYSS